MGMSPIASLVQQVLVKVGIKSITAYGRKKGWKHIEKADQDKRKWENDHMYDSEWMIIKRWFCQKGWFYIGAIIAFLLWQIR